MVASSPSYGLLKLRFKLSEVSPDEQAGNPEELNDEETDAEEDEDPVDWSNLQMKSKGETSQGTSDRSIRQRTGF